jgi:hypothetical protein
MDAMAMEVGGLQEVMSWVMGLEAFGRLSVLQQIKKDEGFTHRQKGVERGQVYV